MGTSAKPPLLLFLSSLHSRHDLGPIAASLAWMARRAGYLFDLYFDSYHLGIHYGGSHAQALPEGSLNGGTVVAGRHVEALYYLHAHFDIRVALLGDSYLAPILSDVGVPIYNADNSLELYQAVMKELNIPDPSGLIVTGEWGTYAYPEIYRKELPAISLEEFRQARSSNREIAGPLYGLFLTDAEEKEIGITESLLRIEPREKVGSITRRMAERHINDCGGWLFADPVCTLHWIPTAVEDRLLPLYSEPSKESIDYIAAHPDVGHSAVLGRQTRDDDFFALSRAGRSLQVIDPNRPPFQAVKHVRRRVKRCDRSDQSDQTDPSDDELTDWAHKGTLVSSLVFWSGAIREVENFFGLVDLIARHRLHCGFAVCGQTAEAMPHEPFSLIGVPVDRGGVGGLVELLLGSAGVGIAIEGEMPAPALQRSLIEGLDRLKVRVEIPDCIPSGWWVTLDAPLKQGMRPFPVSLSNTPPRMRIRYEKRLRESTAHSGTGTEQSTHGSGFSLKQWMQKHRLDRYFEPLRPFESMAPGEIAPHIIDCGKAAGLKYLFTKSGFAPGRPKVVYEDNDFIAVNYTAGRWDGWTPFETINHVSDLERSERMLLSSGKPGWILGTIDSCLWTFGGHLLERGADLERIARFFVQGGKSGRTKNVRPNVVARYARILQSLGRI